MTIGKVVYNTLYKPTYTIRYNVSHFGLTGWLRLALGEYAMKKAAKKEKPIHLDNDPQAILFSYLTGENYWHQTLYSIKSLHQQLGSNFRINIYSDGTLNSDLQFILKNFCPDINIITEDEILRELNLILPQLKYPSLRYLREWHPFFKKLIDIHIMAEWTIHLDSDMLFFKEPVDIVSAYKNKKAIYMKELLPESFYVDDVKVLKEKYNINTIPNVNGGVIAFNSALINYDNLERIAATLINDYKAMGPARIEQTLEGNILFEQHADALNHDLYKIYYDLKLDHTKTEVLKHYIFKAKLPFFRSEWKKIL